MSEILEGRSADPEGKANLFFYLFFFFFLRDHLPNRIDGTWFAGSKRKIPLCFCTYF